jgi:hypothetical protein
MTYKELSDLLGSTLRGLARLVNEGIITRTRALAEWDTRTKWLTQCHKDGR